MKKTFLIVLFLLIDTTVFAQNTNYDFREDINTSEGLYSCFIKYYGKNLGVQIASAFGTNMEKLSNGQVECVNKLLSHYKYSRGDTFTILIAWADVGISAGVIALTLEFTSNTQYIMWANRQYQGLPR